MQITKYIVSLCLLILTTSVARAETATSGNLLPNAGDGRSNPQKTTSILDNTGSGSGFTLDSGITAWANELEAEGTGTVSATGSLENITTTTQSGNSHTTTTTSLDGGVTLNSSTEVQNCEHSSSQWRCGNSSPGIDSYSTTIKILDENDNVLASTSITRNNDAGYYDTTYTYTDTVTHNDTGSRKWDWQWQGINGANTSTTSPDGPNLLGASLTATLLDITYQPAPLLSTSQQTEITNATSEVEDAIEEIKFDEIENIKIEEVKLEEIKFEEVKIEEIELEEFEQLFEENFKEILVQENLIEEFETALIEEGLTEQEFFEEATSMVMEELKEEFGEETFKEELNEETVTEETQMEEVKEEETLITEKPKEEINETESTTTESMEETPNESAETGETSENVSTESDVAEDKETESETTETSNEEGVESEETGDVKSNVRAKTTVDGIEKKVEKVIAKVMAKLKKVDQQLAAIQLIKTKGISAAGADISGYINKKVYTNQNQLTEIPFYSTVNILEQSQIYGDKSLVNYTSNDPILQQQVALVNVQSEINTLRSEIYALKESIK